MRAAILLVLSLTACSREHKPAPVPEVVAIKVAAEDMARYRAMALGCGAAATRVETIGDARLLVVGAANSLAARDCFFARAHADYRAHHPVKAWIEGLIG